MTDRLCEWNSFRKDACLKRAQYLMTSHCTGCPSIETRFHQEYMCGAHLAQAAQGNAVCSVCGSKIAVTGYKGVTQNREAYLIREEPIQRITDATRNAAIERLGDAYADGRLTLEEFTQRADKAALAKVQSDLDDLLKDVAAIPVKVVKTGTYLRVSNVVAAAIAIIAIIAIVALVVDL